MLALGAYKVSQYFFTSQNDHTWQLHGKLSATNYNGV